MVWQFFDIPVPCPFAAKIVLGMMFLKCSNPKQFRTKGN